VLVAFADAVRGACHAAILWWSWRDICTQAKITAPRGRAYPPLRRYRIEPGGGVSVRSRLGGATETLIETPDLHHSIGCRECTVTSPKSGWVEIVATWADRLSRPVTLADLPEPPPGRVTFGLTATGGPAAIKYGESVLIGGITRSGKSTCIWCLLAGLRRERIPTDLYVSDAKGGIELRALEDLVGQDTGLIRVRRYARDDLQTEQMLETAVGGMRARMAAMRESGERKHSPTRENPLVVVLIDEILPLVEQLKAGTKSPLGILCYQGAAAGYVVWAGTQVGTVDSLGRVRDLIPQRICFGTKNREMTVAILGPEAPKEGARAWKIRIKGVGYFEQDGERGFERFRAALVTDPQTERIGDGSIVFAAVSGRRGRTALYRHYGTGPDSEPAETREAIRPLYVGMSYNAVKRFTQHQGDGKDWTRRVTSSTTEYFDTRAAAREAELSEIRSGRWEANIEDAPGWRPSMRRPKRRAP
jgi:hypothetical protein